QQAPAIAIVDIGRVDEGLEEHALRADEQVALAPGHLLAGVVAVRVRWPPLSVVLTDWTRDDRRAGRRLAPHPAPRRLAQPGMDPLPGAVLAPQPEVVLDRLPGRQVVRQQAPGLAAAPHVEVGVRDLTSAPATRASAGLGCRHERLEDRPLAVRPVG